MPRRVHPNKKPQRKKPTKKREKEISDKAREGSYEEWKAEVRKVQMENEAIRRHNLAVDVYELVAPGRVGHRTFIPNPVCEEVPYVPMPNVEEATYQMPERETEWNWGESRVPRAVGWGPSVPGEGISDPTDNADKVRRLFDSISRIMNLIQGLMNDGALKVLRTELHQDDYRDFAATWDAAWDQLLIHRAQSLSNVWHTEHRVQVLRRLQAAGIAWLNVCGMKFEEKFVPATTVRTRPVWLTDEEEDEWLQRNALEPHGVWKSGYFTSGNWNVIARAFDSTDASRSWKHPSDYGSESFLKVCEEYYALCDNAAQVCRRWLDNNPTHGVLPWVAAPIEVEGAGSIDALHHIQSAVQHSARLRKRLRNVRDTLLTALF
jgi:hypothetical protein